MSSEATLKSQPGNATTFKDQLDKAAREARLDQKNQGANNSANLKDKAMIEVAEYVPAVSKLIGTDRDGQAQHEDTQQKGLSAPPSRPEHDEHVAEFVREQHRSKRPDGTIKS